jgi:putative ABC transport system permease protein
MSRRLLLVRWSWRDLRQRWVLVATIALVLALGTGVFASLGGTGSWRRASNDASFGVTRVHDLRVELATGNLVPAGTLAGTLASLPDPSVVAGADERLVWPTQAEAPDPEGGTDLVRGTIVGAPADAEVDLVWVTRGTAEGAVLELQFADARELPVTGTLPLSGGTSVDWTGIGQHPEHFTGGRADSSGIGMLDPGGFVVLFTSLELAQQLAGEPGQVNDLVLRLAPGADRDEVAGQLATVVQEQLPVGATVSTTDDIPAYRLLYEDIENDQQVWDLISWIILLGASFAAFNLINRIVEAQRREIGVGMALGVPTRELALRPILVGLQVALLGVLLGVAVSLLLNGALASLYRSILPLPIWVTDFQAGAYARAVAIGLALPLVATVVPVWRAVRVEPTVAIGTGHFSTQRAGLARLGTRLPWPRGSIGQYPVRNLLRNARRSLLTALAVGSSIVVLVGVVGMLDSFTRTIDQADRAFEWRAPSRLDVQLETFTPVDSEVVAAVAAAPGVTVAVPGLTLPGSLRPAGDTDDKRAFDVVLEVLDFDAAPWIPRTVRGEQPSSASGILLSGKAAADLGVGPGDEVTLGHPQRAGLGYRMTTTTVAVAGIHDVPMRAFTYLDVDQAGLFALEGIVNSMQVVPEGSPEEVQRALFDLPGVAAATPVSNLGDIFRDGLAQFSGVLRIMEGAVLLLALLISFNAVSIGMEERRREHATMFAFGLPTRTVIRMTTVEAVTLGLVGTLIGIGVGWLLLQWMFAEMLPETLPELQIEAYLSPWTMVLATFAGVMAVAITPLFTLRRLRRMDVPATLRVVE